MKIDHIGLYVSDLDEARGFFEKYFGAMANDRYTNPRKGFASYFLTFADGPRTTGDGCYESCIIGIDGNLIEITE